MNGSHLWLAEHIL